MSGWMEEPSAFPVHGGYDGDDPRNQIIGGGMTLRDYFAAKAMQSAISTSGAPFFFRDKDIEPHIAAMAYGMADAMMKAREVKP